jgi:5'(3')-deoxyribonucleotidase
MYPDQLALIDLDSTVADYDAAMKEEMLKLQAPEEPPYTGRYESDAAEPSYMEARRKLIQRKPGFWRNLKPLELGMDLIEEIRTVGFELHVLTKGPNSTPGAWGEKLDWVKEHLPGVPVTVTSDKSLVYGRILVDDYPPYFQKWLQVRPRGLVICVAQPWNTVYGGDPNVFRYTGESNNRGLLRSLLDRVFKRKSGETFYSA